MLLIPVSAYDVRRNVGVRGVALVGVLSTVHASCRALKLLSCVCTCVAHGGGGGGGGRWVEKWRGLFTWPRYWARPRVQLTCAAWA